MVLFRAHVGMSEVANMGDLFKSGHLVPGFNDFTVDTIDMTLNINNNEIGFIFTKIK